MLFQTGPSHRSRCVLRVWNDASATPGWSCRLASVCPQDPLLNTAPSGWPGFGSGRIRSLSAPWTCHSARKQVARRYPRKALESLFLKEHFSFFFNFVNVYLFLRERERERERGRDRETECELGKRQRKRETQNLKQAPGPELSAQSPTWGSNPQTVRS